MVPWPFGGSGPVMTMSEPPRPPYLASDREQIIRRVVVSEALRRAFEHVRDTDPNFEPGYNVHGHFGPAQVWQQHRHDANTFIAGDRGHLRVFAAMLLTRVRASIDADGLVDSARETYIGNVTLNTFNPNAEVGGVRVMQCTFAPADATGIVATGGS